MLDLLQTPTCAFLCTASGQNVTQIYRIALLNLELISKIIIPCVFG